MRLNDNRSNEPRPRPSKQIHFVPQHFHMDSEEDNLSSNLPGHRPPDHPSTLFRATYCTNERLLTNKILKNCIGTNILSELVFIKKNSTIFTLSFKNIFQRLLINSILQPVILHRSHLAALTLSEYGAFF
jgi:hypothetical protein